jgi:hypothetical protein
VEVAGRPELPQELRGNRAELIEISGAGGGCWETRAAPGAQESRAKLEEVSEASGVAGRPGLPSELRGTEQSR